MSIEKKGRKTKHMQHTQERISNTTLYLTMEEYQVIQTDLSQYTLLTAEQAEEVIPFTLRWAYSVSFDDDMQFELRLGLVDHQRALFIADWYRDGVFYQEDILTQNPLGQTFQLVLPLDQEASLDYEVKIETIETQSLSTQN